jgi:methylated-DNA-[protein]-cysteine S-methyltransferase
MTNTTEPRVPAALHRSRPAAARLAAAQARTDTPLGLVTLAATSRGLCGLWFDGQQHHPGTLDAPVDATQRFIAQALEELARYWATSSRGTTGGRGGSPAGGRGRGLLRFSVPIDLLGTPFQRSVWTALQRIAPGATASYSDVARAAGHGSAVRAVGVAIGRNPLSIIVPCHRVIGRDGSLTGYAGGLDRKRRLLDLEAAAAGAR